MNNKNQFYVNLLLIIISPIFIVAGVLMVVLSESNRLTAFGYALLLLGAFFLLMWLIRVLALHSIKKEKRQEERKELLRKQAREKMIGAAKEAVQNKTEYPATNTVKIIEAGMEFFAEGKYVCVKDFKGISGHHFAFEVSSTDLKHKPADYNDVCDLEGNGVLVAVGYLDGEALEKYANDNGVILDDTPQNSIGKTIPLDSDSGYVAYVWAVDGDEVDYGFVKLLKCENDVLTVYFWLNVPAGLGDTVEGVVELKQDDGVRARNIRSLISETKRKYNRLDVSAEEVQAIKQANPFLPESYLAFLTEVGFADLDWIDVGWNNQTPTNLNDEATAYINEILSTREDVKSDDFYFIGVDSSDTYYAFSKNADDKKVYFFSNDAPYFGSYETFEEFLAEIVYVNR